MSASESNKVNPMITSDTLRTHIVFLNDDGHQASYGAFDPLPQNLQELFWVSVHPNDLKNFKKAAYVEQRDKGGILQFAWDSSDRSGSDRLLHAMYDGSTGYLKSANLKFYIWSGIFKTWIEIQLKSVFSHERITKPLREAIAAADEKFEEDLEDLAKILREVDEE